MVSEGMWQEGHPRQNKVRHLAKAPPTPGAGSEYARLGRGIAGQEGPQGESPSQDWVSSGQPALKTV